jgi:hypothetical protein
VSGGGTLGVGRRSLARRVMSPSIHRSPKKFGDQ